MPQPAVITAREEQSKPGASSHNRLLPVLLLLFAGSGCAALIYEIVWLQMLQLVIGSTAVSLGVLLGTFMGGMCLGSLLAAKNHRLRPASAAGLCIAGTGNRRDRHRCAVWDAIRQSAVYIKF